MSSVAPDVYIDVPIETDPQDLLNDAYSYLTDMIPGWEPSTGNLDVWIMMAFAALAAETRDVASSVPASIFRWFGANLVNLPPMDAVAATCLTKWTMVDANGYTVPAGTQVAIPVPGSDPIPFITTLDAVIAPGSTVIDNILIEAVDPGSAGNNLGMINGPVVLLDALSFVNAVTQDAVSAGGVDEELDSDYLDRLAAELQLLSPEPILASDFAIYSRNVTGVYRATAIDLYNPLHNLLTANDASLETSVGDWVNKANATVTQDATFGVDGTHSLKLVSVAAGDMTAVVSATGNVPVTVNESYTFLASVKPAAARTCYVGVDWYTSGGGLISTVYGTGIACAGGATTALTATLVAPATAAFARIVVRVAATAAANEVANFDKMSVRHGITTDWVAGGTAETNVPRCVTVACVDINGVAVSPTVKTNVYNYLQAAREVNFIVGVIDPTFSPIDVTTTVKALPNWDPSLVSNSVQNALSSFLNPATWGTLPNDNPQDWTNTPILRYLELAQAVSNAPGVNYITSLTFAIHGQTLAGTDITLPGVAPLPQAGTFVVNVT